MSTTHTVHEDVQVGGLADGCPRCDQHARAPFHGLDEECLRALFERVVNDETPRSDAERMAMNEIRTVLRQALWLAELNPIMFAKHLKDGGVHLIAVVKP